MSPKMLWIYSACLTASFFCLSLGHNTMFEGYDLSLSGYYLCTKTVTENSSKVVPSNVSYSVRVVCGGWLPYKTCPKTVYKTSYRTVVVSATKDITSCCDGYEQVGSYCALPLSRSAVFTARPGSCPKQLKTCNSLCQWDTDCSAGEKCCSDGDQSCCTDARPVGGWKGWWLNMTVFVKSNHTILKTLPGAILNHTRLLHAMVTGALEPQNISVHHIGCHPAGTFRTSTELLIGSVEPLELQTTTPKLQLLQKHIEEVSWVNVQDVNECTSPELNSCSPNAECLNTEGSFNCSCLPGFTDMNPNIPGQLCQDVDECASPDLNCSMNAECFNTEGSYTCSCLPGFTDVNPNITGQLCQDVNECTSPKLNNCSSNAECINTEGSYDCSCLPGFTDMDSNITGRLCLDVDECASPDLNCSMNAECFNTEGSYTCSCLPGFTDVNPNITGQLCQDVNECTSPKLNNCSSNTECINTEGSYDCSCLPGFTDMDSNITGQLCLDVDECASPDLNCSMNAECFNTEGSYTCSCLPGFTDMNPNITGQLCQDVNECTSPNLNNCSSNAECINTEGSYDCSCLPGFTDMDSNITGQLCLDVDECASPDLNCSMNAECFNTEGSYTCSCLPGFTDVNPNITGQLCQDVNECTSHKLNNCSSNAECINTEGSYYCSCLPGFTDMDSKFPGQHCEDVQMLIAVARLTNLQYEEVFQDKTSPEYSNLSSSIEQQILASLPPDMQNLIKLRTVQIQITGFSPGSVVVNFMVMVAQNVSQDALNVSQALISSLQISSVYDMDNSSIKDLNECEEMKDVCSPHANCTNTWASYTCACWEGYTDANLKRPGQTCVDVNECSQKLNNCSSNAECINTEGSYYCSCLPGFTDMDSKFPGRYCEDVEECTSPELNNCSMNAECLNTEGSYTCSCLPGFIDLNPNITGQLCQASPVIEAKSTTATVSSKPLVSTTATKIITSTSTAATSLKSADTTTFATITASPITSPVGVIAVECRASVISVTVDKAYLIEKSITESSLYLGKPECGVTGGNTSHAQLTARWDQCGAVLQHNNTHNSAQLTLFNNRTSEPSNPKVRLEIPIVCMYRKNILISTGYSPTSYDLIKDVIKGSGTFNVIVQLLNGTDPLPQNYSLSPNEEVVVEVAINSSMDQIKVVINECWVTPSSDPQDPSPEYFLRDSCPVAGSHTTVLHNGNSSTSRLAMKVFSFAQQNMIYLHCKVQICFETAGLTCRQDCTERTERAKNIVGTVSASCGPFYKMAVWTDNSVIQSTQEVVFIIVGVAVGALIAGVLSIVCYRKRRVGHYNFNLKPKPEVFTYNAFDK